MRFDAGGFVAMNELPGGRCGFSRTAIEHVRAPGNSLTSVNDLPRLVQAVSQHDSSRRIYVDAVALPDFSLEDHWNDGRARRRFSAWKWTLVVIQQGPSGGAEGRRVLREYAARFGDLAKRRGARVALYTVWPARSRAQDFDAIIESHALAAREAGGDVIPVGVAWRAALQEDSTLSLYGPDGFHPSDAGTYLAALVFREWLTGESSIGFSASWRDARRLRLRGGQIGLLERAAHASVGR
jgi:hypothetical protein